MKCWMRKIIWSAAVLSLSLTLAAPALAGDPNKKDSEAGCRERTYRDCMKDATAGEHEQCKDRAHDVCDSKDAKARDAKGTK